MGIVAMIPIIFELLIISVAKGTNNVKSIVPKVEEDFQEGRMMMQDMKKEITELKANMSAMSKSVNELSTKNLELNEALKKLSAPNEEIEEYLNKLDEKNENLTVSEVELRSKTDVVFKEVSFLKNPPYYHICVFLHEAAVSSEVLSFQKVLFNECNMCDDADFDLDTGVYINGWPGIYTVTWDLLLVVMTNRLPIFIYSKMDRVLMNQDTIQDMVVLMVMYGSKGEGLLSSDYRLVIP